MSMKVKVEKREKAKTYRLSFCSNFSKKVRICPSRVLVAHVPLEKYLRVLREDINERQQSTNQETIDINKLWLTGGLARHRFGCKSMRKMAGPKSAIIHISTIPSLLFLRSRPPVTGMIHCVSNIMIILYYYIKDHIRHVSL